MSAQKKPKSRQGVRGNRKRCRVFIPLPPWNPVTGDAWTVFFFQSYRRTEIRTARASAPLPLIFSKCRNAFCWTILRASLGGTEILRHRGVSPLRRRVSFPLPEKKPKGHWGRACGTRSACQSPSPQTPVTREHRWFPFANPTGAPKSGLREHPRRCR